MRHGASRGKPHSGESGPCAIAFSQHRGHLHRRLVADILITGATGFVGSHLVEALGRRGIGARALVRASSDTSLLERHGIVGEVGDLLDAASLRRVVHGADTVVHLAAATRALRPATFHRVNADGTRLLMQAMKAAGARRMVYLSSLAAAGPATDGPVGPGDPAHPITAYGRSKLAGERACMAEPAIDTVVLRPPAVYGPGDRDLLTFFKLADRGVLPVLGSIHRRLQMIHASDLADAIVQAAVLTGATGVFHVAEPVAYTWERILELMRDAVGVPGRRIRVPGMLVRAAAAVTELAARFTRRPVIFDRDKAREILAAGWLCETDRAREELGFVARIPLPDGLRETADWYRTYGWL